MAELLRSLVRRDRRIAKPVMMAGVELNMSIAILVIGYMTFLLPAQDADVNSIFALIDPDEPEKSLIEPNAERDAHDSRPNETQDQLPRARCGFDAGKSVDGKHSQPKIAGLLAVSCIAWLGVRFLRHRQAATRVGIFHETRMCCG
jgi:hypothetical protein